jgi:RNA polymerase-binding transcription factor DksA
MDIIQDIVLERQDAILAERLRVRALLNNLKPPEARDCDGCECPIPPGRLKARPEARLCVDCQSDLEAGRR